MAAFWSKFLYSQFLVTPPRPEQDCTGKTIIVTGANVGLGKVSPEAKQWVEQVSIRKEN